MPVDLITGPNPQLTDQVAVYKVSGGVPSYIVDELIEGEDSYSYEIYFTGKHLAVMPLMTTSLCNTYAQFGSYYAGVDALSHVEGGSSQYLEISFSSGLSMPIASSDKYWKLVYDGRIITPSLPWGATAQAVQSTIVTALAAIPDSSSVVTVTRSGFGSKEENYGYTYSVTFGTGSWVGVGKMPSLSVAVNGSIATPKFVPGNGTEPKDNLNDMTAFGPFIGGLDYLYTVEIVGESPDQFIWYETKANSRTRAQAMQSKFNTIVKNTNYTLSKNVSIQFASSLGHQNASKWVFAAIHVENAVQPQASISCRVVRDSMPVVNEIALSQGYSGESYSVSTAYLAVPTVAVADQSVPSISWVTANSVAPYTSYSYTIKVNNVTTSCVSWDAFDTEIESQLFVLKSLCPQLADLSSCLTVVRSQDPVNNPNGYTYNMYFEHPKFFAPGFHLAVSLDASGCGNAVDSHLLLTVGDLKKVSIHSTLTRTQIPLASPYKGPSVTRVPIYKISGSVWAVTFDSNLGNLDPLVVAPTDFLTDQTVLTVYDDVVQGELPSVESVSAYTGIDYTMQVQTYTRGYQRGYGNFTRPAVGVASNPPPTLNLLKAEEALLISEVQEVVVAASRVVAVQNVTTSAVSFPEVQEVKLAVSQGVTLEGNFTLRFPEVQLISLASTVPLDQSGSFSIEYDYYATMPRVSLVQTYTQCLPFTASADDVRTALLGLTEAIDNVEVVRSVQSGYSFGGYSAVAAGTQRNVQNVFGFVWTVSFVGNQVAGNVQQMKISSTDSTGTSCVNVPPASGAATTLTVETMNENRAMGLDTEIQVLQLRAIDSISQGQYKLSFTYDSETQTTACIDWNADATVLQLALQSLTNIDNVLVERTGDGTLSSKYGYTYSIYFTGNMLHSDSVAGKVHAGALGALTVNLGAVSNGCLQFKHFKAGVLTNFATSTSANFSASSVELWLTANKLKSRGFRLGASSTTGSVLKAELGYLPTFVSIADSSHSLSDNALGYRFVINMGVTMGNAPSLVCGVDSQLGSLPGVACQCSTLIDGNYIGGYFILGDSQQMASSISAADMATQLQLLPGIGSVAVSRTGPDYRGGYSWLITYITRTGEVPLLTYSNSLSGVGTSINVSTVQRGNYLAGSFTLSFNGSISQSISVSASGADMQKTLRTMSGLEGVVVNRSDLCSSEGGYSYFVTFLSYVGDAPALVANISGLSGMGASIKVLENSKGSPQLGTALSLSFAAPFSCSYSQVQVGECGAPVDSYQVSAGLSEHSLSQTYSLFPDYNVQYVRLAAPSLVDRFYFTGKSISGFFQLTYNGVSTQPISATASSTDVRMALEALPDIVTVKVSTHSLSTNSVLT